MRVRSNPRLSHWYVNLAPSYRAPTHLTLAVQPHTLHCRRKHLQGTLHKIDRRRSRTACLRTVQADILHLGRDMDNSRRGRMVHLRRSHNAPLNYPIRTLAGQMLRPPDRQLPTTVHRHTNGQSRSPYSNLATRCLGKEPPCTCVVRIRSLNRRFRNHCRTHPCRRPDWCREASAPHPRRLRPDRPLRSHTHYPWCMEYHSNPDSRHIPYRCHIRRFDRATHPVHGSPSR